MKLNTLMPAKLKPYFQKEINDAATALTKNNLLQSWQHLERAHVIGQPYPYEHTLAHFKMLGFGIHTKNIREIIGQLPRLLVGGVKSFVGVIPTGNTGGANVSALKPMEIPDDLKAIIKNNS